MDGFVELHGRSAFSFLRGAELPEEMVRRAAALGQGAIGLCDHMGVAGSARAHRAAGEVGIRAIAGTTLEVEMVPADGKSPVPAVSGHFPVLCATRDGYRSLCRHLTTRLMNDETGIGTENRILKFGGRGKEFVGDRAWSLPLPAAPQGSLIALTGDREGPLCRALLAGDRIGALAFAEALVAAFGRGNVFVEIVRHGLRDEAWLQRRLVDLAGHLGLGVVACNAPLHATRAGRPLSDAFACLRRHTTLDRAGTLLAPNAARHLRTTATMRELFADLPEALSNTQRIAGRIEFGLENLGYRFPTYRDPESQRPLSPDEQARLLRRRTIEGAKERFRKFGKKERNQLNHELLLIEKLGFCGYFLIVHDIVLFARSRGILCQGRGSAANSAVCFALGITAVDPVGGGLLFERFLSENRRTWPDIDIDFPSGPQREAVIRHVFESFNSGGHPAAAMTANVITYRPRSAFREMSKVLGFPESVADRFSETRAAPRGEECGDGKTPADPAALAGFSDRALEEAGVPRNHPRFAALKHLCTAVLGLPRHLGQHPGGMVVCDSGLDSVVPLQPAAMPGRSILQWDKDDCEDLGIVKIDLLGLGMLAAIEDTLHVCAARGRPVDLARIPKDDPAVFDLLCRADTIGVFQVESRAQMATLPILRPRTFYDIAIEVAIIRPGPIVGDLLHPYLNRRNRHEAPDCIHPALEPVLARTLGVPLFQEQVLRMAMILAGFDGAEADELRRAMAFKRADEKMHCIAARLRARMTERGIAPEVQEKVVKSIGSFALYGFPESHAISFALIVYASCWLKVHRPAEFYAGLLNNQPMGFYSPNTLIADAKRRGLRVRPVSCTESEWPTTVPDDATLRLGLHRLKGLGRTTATRLLAERARAPFASLGDFLARVRPTRRERRLLALSGALNDLPGVAHRRHALWETEAPLHPGDLFSPENPSQSTKPEPAALSGKLSGDPPEKSAPDSPAPPPGIRPMTPPERLAADLAAQGATTGPHPMRLWRKKFQDGSFKFQAGDGTALETENLKLETFICRAAELGALAPGTPVAVAGMVICRQRPSTAKGHCFISLEDETGIANLFVHRNLFQNLRLLIASEPFLLARGRLQISEGGQPTLFTTHLAPLPGFHQSHAAESHDFH